MRNVYLVCSQELLKKIVCLVWQASVFVILFLQVQLICFVWAQLVFYRLWAFKHLRWQAGAMIFSQSFVIRDFYLKRRENSLHEVFWCLYDRFVVSFVLRALSSFELWPSFHISRQSMLKTRTDLQLAGHTYKEKLANTSNWPKCRSILELSNLNGYYRLRKFTFLLDTFLLCLFDLLE